MVVIRWWCGGNGLGGDTPTVHKMFLATRSSRWYAWPHTTPQFHGPGITSTQHTFHLEASSLSTQHTRRNGGAEGIYTLRRPQPMDPHRPGIYTRRPEGSPAVPRTDVNRGQLASPQGSILPKQDGHTAAHGGTTRPPAIDCEGTTERRRGRCTDYHGGLGICHIEQLRCHGRGMATMECGCGPR